MANMKRETGSSRVRLFLIALILVLGAFWVGARYGPRQARDVEARRAGAISRDSLQTTSGKQHNEHLTEDEATNVRIYRQSSPAVANILTKATEYDFFMDPVPVEGAGSG